MKLVWTNKALSDVDRLNEFLSPVNKEAAKKLLHTLTNAPTRLIEHPRLGEKIQGMGAREVRRFLIGNYELHYEIRESVIRLLRIWHTRESR